MHHHDDEISALAEIVVGYALERMRMDPPPLDAPRPLEQLRRDAGGTITPAGIGGPEALRIFAEVLAPACVSIDHPRHFAFVPAAPTEASVLFDLVVGASSIYAGSWLEGAGAVFAENEALVWIAGLAGFPDGAGGAFVSGGTAGNLSALVAARWRWRERRAGGELTRPMVLTSTGAHSSVAQAARVMDADVMVVPADDAGRLTRHALAAAVSSLPEGDRQRVAAIVATAGTTNAGVVDDLAGAADVAADIGAWLHVDGAYGAAGLLAPSVRHRFAGIERSDSFIVDPHKWLFAPFDSCALVYRDPTEATQAHTQHAEYLDVLHRSDASEWNPSDLAHQLSRRARGLPLWFSLATHGTAAYVDAVEATLRVARDAADLIDATPCLRLVTRPELSIVLLQRRGWDAADHHRWSADALRSGLAFVMPTTWAGETVLRLCIVNPRTTLDDVRMVVASLSAG